VGEYVAMKSFLNRAAMWKLSIFKCVNGSFIVGATFAVTSLHNMKWENMDFGDKFCFFMGMYIAMGKSVDMFLDQSMTSVKDKLFNDSKNSPHPIP
jgi:hypothetical protein